MEVQLPVRLYLGPVPPEECSKGRAQAVFGGEERVVVESHPEGTEAERDVGGPSRKTFLVSSGKKTAR